MTANPSPYQIKVYLEDPDPNDIRHRTVWIATAIDPSLGHPGYTVAEVLAGFRWAAGMIARVLVEVSTTGKMLDTHERHGCRLRPGHDGCGATGGFYLDSPWQAIQFGEGVDAWVLVPGGDGEPQQWVAYVEATLAAMLASDQKPVQPDPAPPVPTTHTTAVPTDRQPTTTEADQS